MENATANSALGFRRLGLLLRRDVAYGYRGTLIAMASVAGVLLLSSLLDMIGVRTGWASFHPSFFTVLLFVGGFIYTSLVFRELHNGPTATLFLTLPSSSFEKFASKALVTSVGYGLAVLVFSTVTAALSEGLNWLIFRENHNLFNPVDPAVLLMVARYVVIQSVFLLGSVYYRKMAFLKTVGVMSLLALVLCIVGLWLAYAVLHDHVIYSPGGIGMRLGNWELDGALQGVISDIGKGAIETPALLQGLARAFEVLFWAALAPACWVIGYLKMREKEV